MITVVLADDHPVVRAGIRNELAQYEDIAVVGEAADSEEVLLLVGQTQPSVALLDCRLPGGLDGITVARRIHSAGWPTRVIALSAYDDEELMYGMWRAGAVGYILKQEALEQIVEAVRQAVRGERLWIEEQVARAQQWWDEIGITLETLTDREGEVLALVAADRSNEEIAEALSISERTVETHIRSLISKTGVRSRSGLAAFYVRHRAAYDQEGL